MAGRELQSFLDIFVPWCAFAYGFLMVVLLSSERFVAFAERRFGGALQRELWAQFKSHEPIAWVCLICGGLWLLQTSLGS